MARVLDQFLFGQLEPFRFASARLIKRPLGFVLVGRQLGRLAADAGGLGSRGLFFLKL